MSIKSVIPSNHLIFCCPLLLLPSIFPSIRVFSNESVFRIRWPKFRSFTSASVFPMIIQGWFSLELTGLILPFKGLSRAFSDSTVWKHQFFCAQLSLWSKSHTHMWLLTLFDQYTSFKILVFKNRSFLVKSKKSRSVPILPTKNKSPIQTSLMGTDRNSVGHLTERPNSMLPSGMPGFRISCLEDAAVPYPPLGLLSCVLTAVR